MLTLDSATSLLATHSTLLASSPASTPKATLQMSIGRTSTSSTLPSRSSQQASTSTRTPIEGRRRGCIQPIPLRRSLRTSRGQTSVVPSMTCILVTVRARLILAGTTSPMLPIRLVLRSSYSMARVCYEKGPIVFDTDTDLYFSIWRSLGEHQSRAQRRQRRYVP
jgi:hypothetical protein